VAFVDHEEVVKTLYQDRADEARPPASTQAGEPDPEDPVSPIKSRALHRALEDDQLMAEREVLCEGFGAAL
jgi:hypothetical protein